MPVAGIQCARWIGKLCMLAPTVPTKYFSSERVVRSQAHAGCERPLELAKSFCLRGGALEAFAHGLTELDRWRSNTSAENAASR